MALRDVLNPGFQIVFPTFGSFYSDAIGNGFSRKHEITRDPLPPS